jgi:SAM-dependent methyltransferase
MRLLPPEALVRTGPLDQAHWNYRLVLSMIERARFRLATSLLPENPVDRLLEVGYGSGVFMPELAKCCRELYGVDVHSNNARVADVLRQHKIEARLESCSVAAMPFSDSFFDCAVAVSTMEFVDDLPTACQEVRRVLRPGGSFVVITPGHSLIVDAGFKLLTGKSAQREFGSSRAALVGTLPAYFTIEKQLGFPALGGAPFRLFLGLRLLPRTSGAAEPSLAGPPDRMRDR